MNIKEESLVKVFGSNWQAVLNKELYPYFPVRSRWGFSKKYIGYKAEGWLGQYLVIYPEKNIVACRMVRQIAAGGEQTEMKDFEQYVYRLVN